MAAVSQTQLQIAAKEKELHAAEQAVSKASTITVAPHEKEKVWWTAENAMTVSSVILIFGFAVCCLIAYLSVKNKDFEGTLRTFGTILIIIARLFSVVAGYDDKQVAPVMVLLGTIAGYLLGEDTK